MKSRILKYKVSKKIPQRFEFPIVSKKRLISKETTRASEKVFQASIEGIDDNEIQTGINRMVVVGFCALLNLKEILTRWEQNREQLTTYLNEFIMSVTGIIEEQGGIAERFEKNGILFFFGAEGIKQDDFTKAILSSLKIRYRMNKLNRNWNFYHDDTWKAGIGMTAGTSYIIRHGTTRNCTYSIKGELCLFTKGLGSSAGSSQIIITEEMIKNPLFPKNTFEVKNPFHIQAQGIDYVTRVREIVALIKGKEVI